MKTLTLVQGSPEWHEHRATARNASEAAVILGLSKKATRGDLLRMRAIGTVKEISDWVQKNLFDKGHRAEAAARPNVEAIISEELYPATATDDNGYLSASFDGINMDETTFWENKLYNADLAAYIEANDDLPDTHWPQVEQGYMVSGAERALFTLSDEDGTIRLRHWYIPKAERLSAIVAAWKQFDEDLANYQHVEVAPKPEGKAPESLPALLIEVTGMVNATNIDAFRDHAIAVFRSINKDLQTDADFADAEKTVKWCKEVEDRLEAGKQHALSQTADIDALFRAIDDISEEARRVRLDLDKLIKARKDSIRVEIGQENLLALNAHIQTINARLAPIFLPNINADFAGAMKGKKSVQSLRDACDAVLARAKIEASQLSESIGANMRIFDELASDHRFLFHDMQQLVMKPADDFTLAVKARIADHKAAEQAKLEAERERIRQEESEKLRKEAEAQKAAQAEAIAAVDAPSSAPEVTQAGIPLPKENDPAASATTTAAPSRKRPSDNQIIFAVATQFNTDFHTACQWIKEIDFSETASAA